jgi:hypothetical protein
MTPRVIVRPDAEREIQEAFDWYQERSEGLGLEFFVRQMPVCQRCSVIQRLTR